MRIPSTPRREGARSKPVHFQYVGVEKGPPTEAYTAGPTWWGYLHMLKPSKPCVWEITGGRVACRYCAAGPRRVAVIKGWVPLYRRVDTLAWMVPVDEGQRDVIDALPLHTKVMVGRGGGKGVGAWVQPCTNQEPAYVSTLPERLVSADVTESLLRIWALPEVTSYFSGASDTAVSLAGGETGRTDRPSSAPDALPPLRVTDGAEKLGSARGADYDQVVNRIRGRAGGPRPSANGRHEE